MAARLSILEHWRRHIRLQCDAGSGSMVSYVVAAAVFIIASSFLVHFVVEPPGSATGDLDHISLKTRAEGALGVLMGSPGVPRSWADVAADVDDVERLGIIESGTTLRIDPDKFGALARGKLASRSTSNGGIDYAEAKELLGLLDHEFHLRAYPLISPTADDPYGTAGYEDYRIAYVGDYTGGVAQPEAAAEIASLKLLSIGFNAVPRDLDPSGDIYYDDHADIRANLLGLIGASVQQTVLSAGAGTKYDFYRVAPAVYEPLLTASVTDETRALALSVNSDGTLGYTKNREIRAILGTAVMTGHFSGSLTWSEWVDTDRGNLSYDCGDYGYTEVSPDGGATWFKLTDVAGSRSTDCSSLGPPILTPQTPAMTTRTVANIAIDCPSCANAAEVLVAFHWIADNDNSIGYGWVIDDVKLTAGDVIFSKTFDTPEYDMVIVGSDVDHETFTPADLKNAIRDYVDIYGGRIMITGPYDNVQWLDRLFDAGTSGASGGVSTPDVTHPLLTLPNTLNYDSYNPRGDTWDFTGTDDAALFMPISMESANLHVLSVSRQGAWGETEATDEGNVILSSYLPWRMGAEEGARFFANSITYGLFHHLYLEVGPPVPDDGSVASTSRVATMNMHRKGDGSYTEMAFILYVWAGTTAAEATNADPAPVAPGAPRTVSAIASDGAVSVKWTEPSSLGSQTPTTFRVYRGNAPGASTLVSSVTYLPAAGASYVYSYSQSGLTNGVTYYYEITLDNGAEGPHSDPGSATPLGLPGAPAAPTVAGPHIGGITVNWAAPTNTGGGTVYGYLISVNDTGSSTSFHILNEVGNVTTYVDSVSDDLMRYYKVSALNGAGWSANSTASAGAVAIIPATAPTITFTNATGAGTVTLAWVSPTIPSGQTLAGYRIMRSDTQTGTYAQLVQLNSAANVSFVDATVGAGNTKWYKIQAITDLADGTLSTAASGKAMSLPGAPTLFDSSKVITVYTLTWTAPATSESAVLSYNVYRGATSGTLVYLKNVVASPTTDVPGTGSWYYAVTAVSLSGEGARSNID